MSIRTKITRLTEQGQEVLLDRETTKHWRLGEASAAPKKDDEKDDEKEESS